MLRQPTPSPAGDDLTLIKGIKDTRQQLLRDALGIRTFSDLAAASPERIFAAFRAQAQPISRATIEQWIEQARILMIAPGEHPDDEAPLIASPQEWRALAQFGVIIQGRAAEDGSTEYRTNVYHHEADEDQHWAGVALTDALGWIDGRIDQSWRTTAAQPTPITIAGYAAAAPVAAVDSHERLQTLIAKTERILSAPLSPTLPPSASPAVGSLQMLRQPTNAAESGDAQGRLQHYLRRVGSQRGAVQPAPAKELAGPGTAQPKTVVTGVEDERLRALLQKHGWR